MPNPVVHFEIIGKDPLVLRNFYQQLFGWDSEIDSSVATEISEKGSYGFIQNTTDSGKAIPGGIGGGPEFKAHVMFYVGVDNVPVFLNKAVSLGGKIVLGAIKKPGGGLVIAHFTDPEGNLIGIAGPQ
jgi:predicted enzyme related to lactoylglutathione lyase